MPLTESKMEQSKEETVGVCGAGTASGHCVGSAPQPLLERQQQITSMDEITREPERQKAKSGSLGSPRIKGCEGGTFKRAQETQKGRENSKWKSWKAAVSTVR